MRPAGLWQSSGIPKFGTGWLFEYSSPLLDLFRTPHTQFHFAGLWFSLVAAVL